MHGVDDFSKNFIKHFAREQIDREDRLRSMDILLPGYFGFSGIIRQMWFLA
jgi:hypothetical protein